MNDNDRSSQLLIITTIVMVVAALALGRQFANPENFKAVLVSFTSIGFISLGMMALMIAGVFDLSVGSVFAIGMISVAYLTVDVGLPWPLAIAGALAICGACGALNGFLVTKMKINPLIATLGTMGILRGVAIIVGGVGKAGLPEGFTNLGRTTILGLGLPVWLFFHFR